MLKIKKLFIFSLIIIESFLFQQKNIMANIIISNFDDIGTVSDWEDKGGSSGITDISLYNFNGNNVLKVTASNIPSSECIVGTYNLPTEAKNWNNVKYIKAKIFIPSSSIPDYYNESAALQARFYIKTGSSWQWAAMKGKGEAGMIALAPNKWTTIVGFPWEFKKTDGSTPNFSDVREIGIQIYAYNTNYSGDIYIDDIEIITEPYSYSNVQNAVGFKIKGTTILDYNNSPFLIRGVNNPHIWFQEADNALYEIKKTNANAVRIVWGTADNPYDVNRLKLAKVERLDSIISKTLALKMIPIVEWHDITYLYSPGADIYKITDAANYWVSDSVFPIIKKYEKYLILNIANEAGNWKTTPEEWADNYKQAIDIIRSAGFHSLLMIDAPNWGKAIKPVVAKAQELIEYDPDHNIVFDIHMYGYSVWNDSSTLDEYLGIIKDLNIPLVIGEFGYNYNNGNNNVNCKVDAIKVMELCYKFKIGYIPWSWAGNDDANSWLNMTDDWTLNTLTYWGNLVLNSEYGIKNTS